MISTNVSGTSRSPLIEENTCSNCPTVPNSFTTGEPDPGKIHVNPESREHCSWFEVQYLVKELAVQLKRGDREFDCILAISTGGIIPARLLAEELGIYDIRLIPVKDKQILSADLPGLGKDLRYIVVDDIYDSGTTSKKVSEVLGGYNFQFAFCLSRRPDCIGISGRILNHDRWIVFPWEKERT